MPEHREGNTLGMIAYISNIVRCVSGFLRSRTERMRILYGSGVRGIRRNLLSIFSVLVSAGGVVEEAQ